MRAAGLALALLGVASLGRASSTPVQDAEPAMRSTLEALSHDSLLGRRTGSPGLRAAERIVTARLQRLALSRPRWLQAGDVQIPLDVMRLDTSRAQLRYSDAPAERMVTTTRLTAGHDFLPLASIPTARFARSAQPRAAMCVFGGRLGDSATIAPGWAKERIVLFLPPLRDTGEPDYQIWNAPHLIEPYADAVAILIASLDLFPRRVRLSLLEPHISLAATVPATRALPPTIAITRATSLLLTQQRLETVQPGTLLNRCEVRFDAAPARMRSPPSNLVVAFEGTDPALSRVLIVLTAHLDHLGVAELDERVGVDSVYNGADDGASGVVALLRVAEILKSLREPLKRTIVLAWTSAEEDGMLGSRVLAERFAARGRRVVGAISLDMVGGPTYEQHGGEGGRAIVQAIGAPGQSRAMLDVLAAIAGRDDGPVSLRIIEDSLVHGVRFECAGDHGSFASRGVPSAWLTTGLHADYHRVTDEAGKIDIRTVARVADLAAAAAVELAQRGGTGPGAARSPGGSGRSCAPGR